MVLGITDIKDLNFVSMSSFGDAKIYYCFPLKLNVIAIFMADIVLSHTCSDKQYISPKDLG